MDTERDPEKVLPLPPAAVYILSSLLKGERHAYRLLLDLRKALEGKTVIGTTTLYRLIERMVQEQFIAESDKRPDPSLDDPRPRRPSGIALPEPVRAARGRRADF